MEISRLGAGVRYMQITIHVGYCVWGGFRLNRLVRRTSSSSKHPSCFVLSAYMRRLSSQARALAEV